MDPAALLRYRRLTLCSLVENRSRRQGVGDRHGQSWTVASSLSIVGRPGHDHASHAGSQKVPQSSIASTLASRGSPMPLSLLSPAFSHLGDIPKRYTCEGADISPPLSWSHVREGTNS